MEQIKELIRRYGLEEDLEHVIIPFVGGDGRKKRCFLLKRRFLRLVYPDGRYEEFPLEEVIEATVRYPDLLLSSALQSLHAEIDAEIARIFGNEKNEKEMKTE
jgi:hypothetical protein